MTDPPMPDDLNDAVPLIPDDAPLPVIAKSIFATALRACSIDRAVERSSRMTVSADGRRTWLLSREEPNGAVSLNLTHCRNLRIVAVGKAAGAMLEALLPHIASLPGVRVQGVLITACEPSSLPAGFQFFAGGHPLPNEASFAGARAALELVSGTQPADAGETLCVFLLSGGASAMMELPLNPSISR